MGQPLREKLSSVDLWTDVADDIWQVRMPNGSLHAMSVDELDAAFARGEVDVHTKVQRPSGSDWMTIAEAAGLDGDSIAPMAIAADVRTDIPRPPPLPKRPLAEVEQPLSAEELALIKPRRTGQVLAAMGAISLLVGGLVAWRFLPAHPIPSFATTTIMAPSTDAPVAAAQPMRAVELEEVAPETSPAPEDNAAPPPAATKKAATPAKKKATTLKKTHGKSTVTFKKHA